MVCWRILFRIAGATVASNQVIGRISEGANAEPATAKAATNRDSQAAANTATAAITSANANANAHASPAVRKLLAEHNLKASQIPLTGKHDRLLKEDVEAYLKAHAQTETEAAPESISEPSVIKSSAVTNPPIGTIGDRLEKRVPMTRLRARIAERLLQVQQSTAMLTTFNEINMQALIKLRGEYGDEFEDVHGVRLGFMSLFVKAATFALQRYPEINSSVDGEDIIYHGYCDVGIAISSRRGLVVPILRNTEQLSLAEIESAIVRLCQQGT